MNQTALKNKDPGATGTAPRLRSSPAQAVQHPVAPNLDAPPFRLNPQEGEHLLQIVQSAASIQRHHELFLLLQNQCQLFLPHQILVAAWMDARTTRPRLDVISAIPGVRTGQLNGCGIEHQFTDLLSRWIAAGRQARLFDSSSIEPVMHAACHCALHTAMRRMRSAVLHGVRNARDGTDCLYLAMHPVSVQNEPDAARYLRLMELVLAQVDTAYRRVAVLNPARSATRATDKLSLREQEIIRWITEGKTNARIAAILGISFFTVKNHAQRIFRKLEVTNRTEAAARYRQVCMPSPRPAAHGGNR